jgi:GNAT superfamily N-acetyltransferase
MIREATRADDAGAFAVTRSAYPEFVTTEAGFTHRQVTLPPEARARAWVAEEDGRIVAWARAFRRYEESGGSGQLNLSVVPEWRRHGIGTALLEQTLAHLAEAPRVFAFAAEAGRGFAASHGFELNQTMRVSAVDPRTVDTDELQTTAVELRPLVEVGPEETFAVDSVAALDVPAEDRRTRSSTSSGSSGTGGTRTSTSRRASRRASTAVRSRSPIPRPTTPAHARPTHSRPSCPSTAAVGSHDS